MTTFLLDYDGNIPSSGSKTCRAKDPSTCRYHGNCFHVKAEDKKEFMGIVERISAYKAKHELDSTSDVPEWMRNDSCIVLPLRLRQDDDIDDVSLNNNTNNWSESNDSGITSGSVKSEVRLYFISDNPAARLALITHERIIHGSNANPASLVKRTHTYDNSVEISRKDDNDVDSIRDMKKIGNSSTSQYLIVKNIGNPSAHGMLLDMEVDDDFGQGLMKELQNEAKKSDFNFNAFLIQEDNKLRFVLPIVNTSTRNRLH